MTALPRAALKFWDVTVVSLLANGSPATITGADFTLVPPGSGSPGASAVWTSAATFVAGVASILVAGPEHASPPVGALVVPAVGADMYGRVVDAPEEDIKLVDCIRLI